MMSAVAVFQAAIRVKSIYDKNRGRRQENEKIWKSKNFYISLHLQDGIGMEFTAC